MTDEEFVRYVYPDAGCVMQNCGLYLIRDGAADGNKMTPGKALSGRFSRESLAWADAAKAIVADVRTVRGEAQ